MKPAVVIAVILLIAGALWQRRELDRLRAEHESLREQASARGIGPAGETSKKAGRPRRDPLAEARALTDDLIRRAAGGKTYQTDWAAQADLAEKLRGMNPAQLRVMIDAISGEQSIPAEMRHLLTLHLLGRLAEDFPEEVLARFQTELRGGSHDYRVDDVIKAAAVKFAERDPEAAWHWLQRLELDPASPRFQGTRYALLGGIARVDPALALRHAEGSGVEGTGFLRQGERTIDQQLAALAALRTWSGDVPAKQEQLREHIQAETLRPPHSETNRFDVVTGWIEDAKLPLDEIGFLADASKLDLCYYIDPRETGKWIEWLCRTFPDERIEHRLQRIFEDHRTKAEARAWLEGLPADEADAFQRRLADG